MSSPGVQPFQNFDEIVFAYSIGHEPLKDMSAGTIRQNYSSPESQFNNRGAWLNTTTLFATDNAGNVHHINFFKFDSTPKLLSTQAVIGNIGVKEHHEKISQAIQDSHLINHGNVTVAKSISDMLEPSSPIKNVPMPAIYPETLTANIQLGDQQLPKAVSIARDDEYNDYPLQIGNRGDIVCLRFAPETNSWSVRYLGGSHLPPQIFLMEETNQRNAPVTITDDYVNIDFKTNYLKIVFPVGHHMAQETIRSGIMRFNES